MPLLLRRPRLDLRVIWPNLLAPVPETVRRKKSHRVLRPMRAGGNAQDPNLVTTSHLEVLTARAARARETALHPTVERNAAAKCSAKRGTQNETVVTGMEKVGSTMTARAKATDVKASPLHEWNFTRLFGTAVGRAISRDGGTVTGITASQARCSIREVIKGRVKGATTVMKGIVQARLRQTAVQVMRGPATAMRGGATTGRRVVMARAPTPSRGVRGIAATIIATGRSPCIAAITGATGHAVPNKRYV